MSVHERFIAVADERIGRLSQEVLALERDDAARAAAMPDVLRELHTLKGEAGVLGLDRLASLTHAVEDLLGAANRGEAAVTPEAIDAILTAFDLMTELVHGRLPAEMSIEPLVAELRGLGGLGVPDAAQVPAETVSAEEAALPSPEQRGGRALRVDPARVERLSEALGDLLLLTDRASMRAQGLEALYHRVRRFFAISEEPPWLDELSLLVVEAGEDAFAQRNQLSGLGEQLRMLRLSPIRELLEGYRRPARDLARSLGKAVELEVSSQAVEIDQSILELLSEPLLHLVRNALTHGIEAPEVRAQRGKPEAGRLEVTVRQVGSSVQITLSDDGGGIDPAVLRTKAVERRLLSADAAERLSEDEALELTFQAGFSTAELTQDAGRGIGLDVVRERVEQFHGSVRLSTELGVGTAFTVTVPMNIALSHALVCEALGSHYAIAVESVERIFVHDPEALGQIGERTVYTVDGAAVPFCRLSALIGEGDLAPLSAGASLVLVQTSRDGRIVLAPGRVLGQRLVAYRPLGAFLEPISAIQASCVLADGSIALLLNVAELARARRTVRASARPAAAGVKRGKNTILVVEDSGVTRELLVEIVRAAGYAAVPAADGVVALERLRSLEPELILSDLEMPRMNGLDLTRAIRQEPRLTSTPVVIITTRGSEADRRACMDAGATAFLDKSRFQERALLELLDRLID